LARPATVHCLEISEGQLANRGPNELQPLLELNAGSFHGVYLY